MGGTNDWANDRPLGLVDSVDTNDFTGAINKVIEKLITRIPSVKLAFGTPPYSEFIDYASRGWENAFENNNGNTINDYAALPIMGWVACTNSSGNSSPNNNITATRLFGVPI